MSQTAIPIDECDVFIQIWVDSRAVNESSGSNGVYLVDNTVANGAAHEGSASLTTVCPKGTGVCWQVLPVDPSEEQSDFTIQAIGNSSAWGSDGQPKATSKPWIWTGKVEEAGSSSYGLSVNVYANTAKTTAGVRVT
jgi:hypothetical protein